MRNYSVYPILIAVFLALVLMPGQIARAATLTVNQTGTQIDSGDGDSTCSLIDAIQVANGTAVDSDCGTGDVGSDTIILASGTSYNIPTVNDTTDGANGFPSIASSIIIEGNGATINRSGVSNYRIFHISAGGNLTLNDVEISGGQSAGTGGGIFSQGTLSLNRSTIANNTAAGNGGGIYVNGGTVNITNSTISSNSAASGAGIYANSGTVNVNAVTIANQSSGIVNVSGTVNVQSSILDNTTNCGGTISNGGNNLSSDSSCSGFTTSGTINLDGLSLNAPGLTQTHMPGAGSSAINAASSCSTSSDQRGVGRPVGSNCDIGSVEVGIPGFTIDEGDGVAVEEEGPTSDFYTVTVNTPPTEDLYFTITPDSQCEITSPNPVFIAAQSAPTFNVDVRAIDDSINEVSPHTCVITHSASSGDPLYNGIFIADINVSVTDNDTPAVIIDPTAIGIAEGGATATYTIVLATQPTADVNISINTDGQCNVDTPAPTFNDSNWNTPRIITVTAVNDLVDEGIHTCTITHSASSSDLDYGGITIDDVVATITDNDTAGVNVNPATINLTEGGASQTYTITLNTPPAESVFIDFITSLPGECTVLSPNPLEIFAGETGPFIVEVIADDDEVIEGAHTCTISHTATSNDPPYNGIDIDSVTANITDNDSAGLAYNPGLVQVTEGGPGVNYDIYLNTLPAANVSINITTDAQCTITSTNPVTILSGTTGPAIVTIVAVDDTDFEASPHSCVVTHTVSSPDADYNFVDTNFVVEVIDNDAPTISVNDVTVVEGNAGLVTATFTVSLNMPSAQTITANWATADDTATVADSDYNAGSGMVIFGPGDTSLPVNITINGDTKYEANETFFINLTSPTNATIADGQGVGTITNDDAQPQISINDVTVTEGNSGTVNAVFTVSLSNASYQPITVNWATADDTATTADGDYVANSGLLTFPANSTTAQTVTVQVNGDTQYENNETFFVNLTSPTNATIADDRGTGTITNDDAQPQISIDSPPGVAEGNSGQTPITFTVSLTNASYQTITVTWATADNTAATADNDYDAGGPAVLTFAPGGPLAQTIIVQVNGDTTPETDETFFVNLTVPTNATINVGQGVGTILDDDTPPLPTLSIDDPPAVIEGDVGTTNITFTVTLSAASAQIVTVNWSTADNTATEDSDYTTAPTLITFNPGDVTQTLTVQVIGDTLDEADETFFVNLATPTNATILDGQGIGTILDDDDPPTISINNQTAAENGGTITFTVSLSEASGQTVTVNWTTTDDTATAGSDYVGVTTPTLITFAPGVMTQPVTVTLIDDTMHEPNETFFVTLSGATNATIDVGTGIGTITDNDPTPSITILDQSVTEGNAGITPAVFTLNLSNPSSQAVTVEWTTADGTATTADNDYAGVAVPDSVTFAPGTTTQTLTVDVNGDTNIEPDEDFTVNLSNPTNATIADGTATGTILNDDALPTLSINDPPGVAEGNAGTTTITFTVTLSAASPQTVTVEWTTADGTATTADNDYVGVTTPASITFNPGDTTQTLSVTVNGDLVAEPNETFFVNLANPTNATIAIAQGIGTITNDDTATVNVTPTTINIAEGGATDTYTVVLATQPTAAVTITIIPNDQCTVNPTSLTFNPASSPLWNAPQSVTVTAVDDSVVEGTHNCVIGHTAASSDGFYHNIVIPNVTATVTDNDAPPAGVTITQSGGTTAVAEGGATDSYTVVLNTQPAGIVNIAISTSPSGQCTVNPTSLVFNPASSPLWSAEQTVTVTAVDDTAVEGTHTCTINHTATSTDSAYNGIAISSIIVTITDNDTSTGTPSISINDVSANEGNSGTTNFTFTLTRSGNLSGTSSVTATTADNTATLSNNDYVGATQTITFSTGQATRTFTVLVVGDSTIEPDEVFFVNLSNVSGATISDGQGIGTIINDDGVPSTNPTAVPSPTAPPVPLCADLSGTTNPIIRAQIPPGTVTNGNVFCRVLAQSGQFTGGSPPESVGHPQVLSLGVIHAVDVYALSGGSPITRFNNSVLVCLQGSGSLVYMDATQAPRPPVILTNATSDGSYTCANIPNAGTLVLVQSGGNLPGVNTGGGGSGGPSQSLSGCVVTPLMRLNLRSVPGLDGRVLAIVPEGVALGASQRTRRWFRVSFEGRTGWIFAAYVSTNGACGE